MLSPHTDARIVFRQERDAGSNERLVDGLDVTAPRRWETVVQFHALDGGQANPRLFRQIDG